MDGIEPIAVRAPGGSGTRAASVADAGRRAALGLAVLLAVAATGAPASAGPPVGADVARDGVRRPADRDRFPHGLPDGRVGPRRPARPRPTLSGRLQSDVYGHLLRAFPTAVDFVRSSAACEALFDGFGVDGVALLARTTYHAPSDRELKGPCRDGAAGFTVVGSRQTRLCPAFAALPTEEAALILIHEALHYAGLPESPPTESAPTSREINRVVRDRCGRATRGRGDLVLAWSGGATPGPS